MPEMTPHNQKKFLSATASIISALKIPSMFAANYSGLGHILTFHRILPSSEGLRIHNHQSLEITSGHLERIIIFFKKRGYNFYSLDQLHEILIRGEIKKKFVVFTFDDGYADNYTYAYPILKKHNIPFAIYIFTDFPEKKAFLWWYHLEELIKNKNEIRFLWDGILHLYPCKTISEKENAFQKIRNFINISFSASNYLDMFKTIFGKIEFDSTVRGEFLSMDWDQIRELNHDPLVTIGAHSVSHFPLANLDRNLAVNEIKQSKEIIESKINQRVTHFAYPFGKANEASKREFKIIKSMGFKTGTTTRMGNIFTQHKDHQECLPRISINTITSEDVLHLHTTGMLSCLFNRGKQVITD